MNKTSTTLENESERQTYAAVHNLIRKQAKKPHVAAIFKAGNEGRGINSKGRRCTNLFTVNQRFARVEKRSKIFSFLKNKEDMFIVL